MKTQVGNGRINLFNFWGETIGVSDQAILALKHSGLHDEEGEKINIINPLTSSQRKSGCFLFSVVAVQPYQDDPKYKHNLMNCS